MVSPDAGMWDTLIMIFDHKKQDIAVCALFLAAKIEEQPRKLDWVIKTLCKCLHRKEPSIDDIKEEVSELHTRGHDLFTNLGCRHVTCSQWS